MLSPSEFTVGKIGIAKSVSLVLPRKKYEELMLICVADGMSVAVLLSGEHAFRHFESEGNDSYAGIDTVDPL
jgi:hypothetical protein